MSIFSENLGIIITGITGAIGGIAAFFGGYLHQMVTLN
jgi:hypothetical protein